jgi:hypothetical protein
MKTTTSSLLIRVLLEISNDDKIFVDILNFVKDKAL